MIQSIGFIGLGKMGLPMALNLLQKGFSVNVSRGDGQNPFSASGDAACMAAARKAGATETASFAVMAQSCDAVISVVPADKEILSIYTGAGGVIENAREGLYCIDMTSAKGVTKRQIGAYIAQSGKRVHFVDAPVSGGVAGATAGALTIMAGCTDEEYAACLPVWQAMGTTIFHTGSLGTGSDIKMLNQMLNAANTAVAAEILCVSRQLGIDDAVLGEVVNKSSGGSFVFEKNVPKYMMSGDHTPGFRLNLMKKDAGLFIDTVKELCGFTPVSCLVYSVYEATANQGLGDSNYTAIHQWYEQNQSKKGENI